MPRQESPVEILEVYKDFVPPASLKRLVRRLLSYVPAQYLLGLKTVLLTNVDALSRNKRRRKTWSRKKKVTMSKRGGWYNYKRGNEPAWITILVDNVVLPYTRTVLYVPLIRDMVFAEILYHELGHHIHATIAPEHKEREDVANRWERWLTRRYFRRRFWFLAPLWPVSRTVIWLFRLCFKGKKSNRRRRR